MKRIVLVIAVTLPLVACGKEQAKKIEVRPVRVTSVRHTPSGEMTNLTGQMQAKDRANLAFRIGGRRHEIKVACFVPVTVGQLMVKIEPQNYQNARHSLE